MNVFLCDRCNTIIGNKYRYYITMKDWNPPSGADGEYKYHLCSKCGKEFRNFMGQVTPRKLVKNHEELEGRGILECNNCVHKDCCQFFHVDCYCYLETQGE